MLFQLGEEIKNAGVKSFWRNLVSALNIQKIQLCIEITEILATENIVCSCQLYDPGLHSSQSYSNSAESRGVSLQHEAKEIN